MHVNFGTESAEDFKGKFVPGWVQSVTSTLVLLMVSILILGAFGIDM